MTENKTNQPEPKIYRKLSKELIEKLANFVAQGNYFSTACHACGIGKTIFYEWLKQAEEDDKNGFDEASSLPLYLANAIKRAEAQQEAVIVNRLIEASGPGTRKKVTRTDAEGGVSVEVVETGGEWLAAATYLERRHPERYGRKDRSSITIEEHKRVTITHVEVIKDYGQGAQVIESESREIPLLDQGELTDD